MNPSGAAAARILNVDDNDAARYVKTRVLTAAGFHVDEASNGADALAGAAAARPDLVLLDVNLPDINGLEVCRQLKASPSTRSILVLQTSASMVGAQHRVRALDCGADSYLVAPIEPEELIANVRALLRLRDAEMARDESELRFRQLAESITDVFWIVASPALRFVYVSPAYARHWKGDAQGLLADASAWFDAIHPNDRERLRQRFAQLPHTEGYEDEYRVVGPEGDERWVTERVFAVRNGGGRSYRFAGITQDNTLRKRAELLLVDADRRKDEFLAMLSHELRSPLAPIRTAVDVLASSRTDTGAKSNALRIVQRQVDHLARLVDDLLDVARISQGKIALDVQPLQLQGVIAAAIETTQPMLQLKGHTLAAHLPDDDVWVDGDRVRLTQVFGNLLHNAAKFTPPEGAIGIDVETTDDAVAVAISDNGTGIAPDMLPHVFELFSQAHQSLDRTQGGLGIGLSLVERILAMHGGAIHADSEGPGRGSRFTLTLPRRAAPAVDAAREALPAPAGASLRILAVDDNEDALESMAMLLESCGHAVHMATHADTALRLAREVEPQLMLLDIGLPGMNGYELAAALRALELPQRPVLVAVSGYGRETDRERARQAGFEHHLVKPADPEQLLAIIAGVAQNSR